MWRRSWFEGDQHAPAHSYVRLRPQGDANERAWLLAEAHWDQAFTPPAFQQVLLWALGVVPWTVLTQFIGPLARRAQFVQPTPLGVAGYLWRVFVAAATAVIASAFVFALAMLILILSLIPIDSVRNIVGSLQQFASGGVGDLYMVLTSAVQRAALSSAVQRDIDWLRQQGCDRIAMIAHSQGGYVAYQALAEPWPGKVELFVTFGSGLIRLTESERARRTPALLLALIGTIGAILAIRFSRQLSSEKPGSGTSIRRTAWRSPSARSSAHCWSWCSGHDKARSPISRRRSRGPTSSPPRIR